jgi:hypothetical protein
MYTCIYTYKYSYTYLISISFFPPCANSFKESISSDKSKEYSRIPMTLDDDDDVYLDELQTRGVNKSILYM